MPFVIPTSVEMINAVIDFQDILLRLRILFQSFRHYKLRRDFQSFTNLWSSETVSQKLDALERKKKELPRLSTENLARNQHEKCGQNEDEVYLKGLNNTKTKKPQRRFPSLILESNNSTL